MADCEMILHGTPPLTESLRLSPSLGRHYLGCLLEHGHKVAMVQQVDGVEVSVTYSELLRHGKVVAGLLREHGLGSGDTVLVCCGNTLAYPPIMLGTLFVGATLSPIFPAYHSSDMLHLINIIKPLIVICNEQAESSVREALAQYNTPVVFIPMETVNKRLKENPDVEDFYLGHVDDPDTHVAFVLCSSGTTSKPKGVELTHTGFGSQLDVVALFPHYDPSSSEQLVVLNLAVPFWLSCQTVYMFSLTLGYKLVLLQLNVVPGLDDILLETMQRYKVNMVVMAPPHLAAIAKRPPTSPSHDLSSLRSVLFGGGAMSLPMLQLAQKTLRIQVTAIYAMTECVGFSPAHGLVGNPRTIGKVAIQASVKILDIETKKTLGPNKEGELCIKSKAVFKGYRGDPQATKDMFDDDGFMHTGDIGYYDEDGFFYVIDRLKDCFKYQGIQVYPGDIEEVLLQHPEVAEVAVVDFYDEFRSSLATAYVVRRRAASVTEDELVKLVEGQLPRYKWLHGGLQFLDALPRTGSGKVRKIELIKNRNM